MKSTIFKTMAAVTGISLLIFVTSASAFSPCSEDGGKKWGPKMRDERTGRKGDILAVMEELGLSAEQKEQLKEHQYQQQLKKIETRNQIQIKELELRHELEKTTVDKEKVASIVQELKNFSGTKIEQRVDSVLALRAILTPAQYEKFQTIGVGKVKNRMKEHRRFQHKGMQQEGQVQ
ncbi:MAG: periplasmic heavy metal sensor [Candidatus Omnitrophica bacterium]|nr:periplasmic heavy metal sensor [Candidatus Omnitrophota bacterium]